MRDAKEPEKDVDAASRPMRCSTVLAEIAKAKSEIQDAFDEANDLYKSQPNKSFYEGQHHALKYAFLVLESLELRVKEDQ